jgi:plasmid stabilization system protein ParE
MSRATVRFHPVAAEEAEAAYQWYADRSLEAANGFREELRHAVGALSATPTRWPRHGARVRRYVFPRFPFSLLYRVHEGNVEIIAVAHGKRRPGYWRSRLRSAP